MNPISAWWSFTHTKKFDADWTELGMSDEDLARLQNALIDNPEVGDVIAGTGGLRKMRFARPGEGKSGSVRICYAFVPTHGVILLMKVYGKNVLVNLTAADKKAIKRRLGQLNAELDSK
jgi:hypothetical protein